MLAEISFHGLKATPIAGRWEYRHSSLGFLATGHDCALGWSKIYIFYYFIFIYYLFLVQICYNDSQNKQQFSWVICVSNFWDIVYFVEQKYNK